MNISPLNLWRMQQLGIGGEIEADPGRRDPYHAYKRWRCPECADLHSSEDGALACCPPDIEEVYVNPATEEECDSVSELLASIGDGAQTHCPVCGCDNPDEYDAASCCLWKDTAPAARWRIAGRVARGTTWADAIAAEAHH